MNTLPTVRAALLAEPERGIEATGRVRRTADGYCINSS